MTPLMMTSSTWNQVF